MAQTRTSLLYGGLGTLEIRPSDGDTFIDTGYRSETAIVHEVKEEKVNDERSDAPVDVIETEMAVALDSLGLQSRVEDIDLIMGGNAERRVVARYHGMSRNVWQYFLFPSCKLSRNNSFKYNRELRKPRLLAQVLNDNSIVVPGYDWPYLSIESDGVIRTDDLLLWFTPEVNANRGGTGNVVYDMSGNERHAAFDGAWSDDLLWSIGSLLSLDVADVSISDGVLFEIWCYLNGSGERDICIYGDPDHQGFSLRRNFDGLLEFISKDADENEISVHSDAGFTSGAFRHVAVLIDPTNGVAKMAINGDEQADTDEVSSFGGFDPLPFVVGHSEFYLRSVRLYDLASCDDFAAIAARHYAAEYAKNH